MMAKRAMRIVDGLLVLMVAAVFALAALPHVAPTFELNPLIIRGRSMEPAIPLGSVVFVRDVPGRELRVGDSVTVRADNGVVFTHRVTRLLDAEGELRLETKGDANASVDPSLVPERAVLGRVELAVPWLGYVLVLATKTSGMISLLGLGFFLFLLGRFLDAGDSGPRRSPVPGQSPLREASGLSR